MGIEQIDMDIVMRQTGITDKQRVRKVFYKNGKDVSKTILELMDIEKPTVVEKKEQSDLEKLRSILDEKEKIYQTKNQSI
jgi:hypothetical protein